MNINKYLNSLQIEHYGGEAWETGSGMIPLLVNRVRLKDPRAESLFESTGTLYFDVADIKRYGSKIVFFLLVIDAFYHMTKPHVWSKNEMWSIVDHLWRKEYGK